MKKKIAIVLATIFIILLILTTLYFIDMHMMKNNKPVIFSTWGYDYAPPENSYRILEIVDLSNKYSCAQVLEKIYEDSQNEYYFGSMKSDFVTVKYENMGQEKIKSALNKGHITLEDLENFNIDYVTKPKANDGMESFTATILDKTQNYILVEPDECELEIRTADKIAVSFDKENLVHEFSIDDKVIIYYSGIIMESYPAMLKADDIQIIEKAE